MLDEDVASADLGEDISPEIASQAASRHRRPGRELELGPWQRGDLESVGQIE